MLKSFAALARQRFGLLRIVNICSLLLLMLCPTAFAQSCITSVTGRVYSPNGPTLGDPLPNILVFTPLAGYPVPAIQRGVTGGCAAQTALVPSQVMVSSTSAFDGSFTLTNSGLAGTNVPIVIQAGKWRRQYVIPSVPACTTTTFNMNMPASAADGDLPEIAIVTGEEDALECVFRKIGIADTEFTAPNGGGHINLYQGTYPGANEDATNVVLPSESTLLSTAATLNSYDLSLFSCQGDATATPIRQGDATALLQQNNLVSYANSGGRVFATDISQVYLNEPNTFQNVATWLTLPNPGNSVPTKSGNGTATINTSTARGTILSNWLNYVGATPTPGQLALNAVKQDETAVSTLVNVDATLNTPYDGSPIGTNPIPMQFTFDTPLNSTTTPDLQVSFANNPTVFHTADTADTVTINVSNISSTTAADPSLNVTLSLPPGLTAVALAGGNAASGWMCSTTTLVCNRKTGASLAAGATDPILLTVSISGAAIAGNSNLTAAVAGGGQSGTNQCGRVLFNSYHVETPAKKVDQKLPPAAQTAFPFPTECKAVKATGANTLTPQEKFLEYSLYNLSNFISPLFVDVITIQVLPTITWPTPAPIYYGTPLSGTQLDATATDPQSGVAVPGTFVYTPAAGTILDAGSQTLSVSFTPNDTTKYSTNTGTTTLTVNPDTTTIALNSSVNPAVQGQSITFTATMMGNVAAPTGSISFYSGSTLLGTTSLTVANANSSAATYTTTTLPLGTSNITAVYTATTDFAMATSSVVAQVVQANSTTAITGLPATISYGQNLLSGASVVVTGSSTGGTATVYVNGTSVCVLPVGPSQPTTCPAAAGAGYAVGTYTINAVFSGDSQYVGSTSPNYTVQVVADTTTTTLASSLNPSYVGKSVTFTSTVTAPYAVPTGTVTFYDGSTALGTGTLGAASGNTVTATFSTATLVAGSHPITAVYTATTNFATSTSPVVTQVVQLVTPVITWATPASVPYGTALSATQLNATATDPNTGAAIAGTFTYNPAAGTVLNTGANTLNVTFTPTNAATYSSATGSTSLTVTQNTTTTTLTSSLNPSLPTQSVTFTATVTGSNASPTGTVGFYDGSTLLGTGTLTAGTGNIATATFSTTTLAPGSHPITAVYTATTNFGASTSAILTQIVKQSTPVITWATPAPIPYGTALSGTQLNATATDALTGKPIAGTFTYNPAAGTVLNTGSNTLNLTFTPTDTTDYTTATGSTTLTVSANTTTASIVSSVNPSLPTQSVTFTATITGSNASPTGTVSFYDGSTLLGSGTLTAGASNTATATFSTTTLVAGSHPISAVYAATTNFGTSTSPTLTQVVKQATPVITWTTPAAVPYGTALSGTQLNATATDPNTGAPVAGTFTYNPAAGTVLAAGSNTLNVTFTPTNTTVYTSATGTTSLTVTQNSTAITLASSVNPSIPTQSVTFTATITGSNASPTGTVSFYDGSTLLGSGTLTAGSGNTATATFSTTTLATGSHPITAVYTATTNFGASTSAVLTQVVKQITPTITWATPAPIPYGTALSGTQLNATATDPNTGAAIAGTFTYNPAAGTVLATGSNTLNVTFTPTNTTVYTSATGTTSITVTQNSTAITLASSVNPSIPTQSVTFTATITGSNASPTGTVSFYDGSTLLGSGTLTAGSGNTATATFSTTTLATGSHPITAVYTATTNFGTSTSAVLTQVVKQVTPTITWATPAPIPYGTALSGTQLNATATDPTTGATVAGTFVYSPAAGTILAAGSNTLNVTFTPTNATVYMSATGTTTLTVTQDTTAIALTSSLNPSLPTQSVTFTATVTGSNAPPNGTVGFYDGSTLLGTGTLTAGTGNTATATFSTSTLAPGSHPIAAVYTATTNFGMSTSPVLTQVVKQSTPVITWTTPAPIAYGTPLSGTQLNATATDSLTGKPVAGTFTYSPAAGTVLSTGTATLTLTFTPTDTTNYTTATGSTTLTVTANTTATTLTSSVNPSLPAQSVTFTATVTGSNASPTGTVSFYDGNSLLGTGTLTAGAGNTATATFATSTLSTGSHPITAVYTATTNFGMSTSPVLTQVVKQSTPIITWVTPAPVPYGTALSGTQLNATATDPNTGTTVAGTFVYNPAAGTVPPVGTDTLSVTFTPTNTSVYTTATGTTTLTVTQDTTAIALTSSLNPSMPTQSVIFTATVTGSSASPTGTVSFYDGTTLLGTGTLVAVTNSLSGGTANMAVATFTTSSLQPGSHPITAVYTASTNFGASTSPVLTQVVKQVTPVITWPTPSPITYGTALSGTQLNASATDPNTGAAVPGTFTYSPAAGTVLPVGTSTLSVTFTPTDATYYTSASATTSITVNGIPGYLMTVTPTNLNAPIGAATPISVVIASFYGYNVPIALTCSGLPVEATCTFTQNTVTGSATVTLSLTPGAPHDCGVNNPYFTASTKRQGAIWFSSMVLCLAFFRRRKWMRGVALALALCLLPIIQGCGSGGCTDFGTKPGNYSVTITATPASIGTLPGTAVQSQTVTFKATL